MTPMSRLNVTFRPSPRRLAAVGFLAAVVVLQALEVVVELVVQVVVVEVEIILVQVLLEGLV